MKIFQILIVDDERVIRDGLRALLVVTKDGSRISQLTKTEADILKVLLAAHGEPIAKDELIEALRGRGFACVDTMTPTCSTSSSAGSRRS